MKAVYTLEATVTNDGIHIHVEIKSGGLLSEVSKTVLLSNIMKALNLNPDSVSDMAVVSVTLEHWQDKQISGRPENINLC